MEKHNGYTLIEIIAVIAIIAILSGLGGHAYSNMILDGNIQTATTTLQTYGSNLEDGIFNLGYLTELEDHAITQYLYQLEDDYLNCSLDYDTLTPTTQGFTLKTASEQDPWGNAYRFDYQVSDTDAVQIMIASAGPDGLWSERVESQYQSGDYGDDLVLIMTPR